MAFFFAPLATLATYFALGLVVARDALRFPRPPQRRRRRLAAPAAVVDAGVAIEEQRELPLAS